jgi:hypothetical protein
MPADPSYLSGSTASPAVAPQNPILPGAKISKATKQEGTIYIPSWNLYRSNTELTADKIENFKRNVYGKGLELKQKNLIFAGDVTITIYDPKQNPDEELTAHITKMFSNSSVNLQDAMIQRYEDMFWWGPSVYNMVWATTDNGFKNKSETFLEKLIHMPTASFKFMAGGGKVYNKLLQGITLNLAGELELWQTDGFGHTPVKLNPENFYCIFQGADYYLVPDPIVLPIAPVIEMLAFAWNSEMGLVNRMGSPVFFIKITDPEPAHDGNGQLSDTDYANLVMANWDQNQSYPLRGNMEIVTPNFGNTQISIEVIRALQATIIDYASPTSFLNSQNGGKLIGGSSLPEIRLLHTYIKGQHRKIEAAFRPLIQMYLDANGYKDYTVEILLPVPDIDDKTLKLNQAKLLFDTKMGYPNEIRQLADLDQISPEEQDKLIAEWQKFAPILGGGAPPGDPNAGAPAGISGLPPGVAAPEKKNLYDPNEIIQNVYIPSRDEIETITRDNLEAAVERLKQQTLDIIQDSKK